MTEAGPEAGGGADLVVLLLLATSATVDDLQAAFVAAGHPDLRPSHAFAFQAIGEDPVTGTQLAERLGVTKQAVGQMVEGLVRRGYIERGRRTDTGRPLWLTERGLEALDLTAAACDAIVASWAAVLGEGGRVEDLRDDLYRIVHAAVERRGEAPQLRPAW